jgi:hypothetical protein
MRRAGDVGDPGCLDVIGEGVAAAIAILVIVLVLVFVLLPLLVAVIDIFIVAVLALLGLTGRIVFGRPWTVEATATDGSRLRWRVKGWRASHERVGEVAELLRAGITPVDDSRVE